MTLNLLSLSCTVITALRFIPTSVTEASTAVGLFIFVSMILEILAIKCIATISSVRFYILKTYFYHIYDCIFHSRKVFRTWKHIVEKKMGLLFPSWWDLVFLGVGWGEWSLGLETERIEDSDRASGR